MTQLTEGKQYKPCNMKQFPPTSVSCCIFNLGWCKGSTKAFGAFGMGSSPIPRKNLV